MKAELITIGDELLYGQTIDTNAAFIGERLSEAGLELVYHTTVGDESESLLKSIDVAMNRVDIILTTGGLGPTHDDITKKIICQYFKRQLIFHDNILAELEAKYKAQGMEMPPVNQNQALLPQGAKFLDNKIGSALGIVFEENGRIFISMPGVPSEMKLMLTEGAIPMILEKSPHSAIVHRKLRTIGIIESAIYEKTKNIVERKSPVSIAFLPSFKGVDIRLTVKGESAEKAAELIAQTEAGFQAAIAKYIFGYDGDELHVLLGNKLIETGQTIAIAESCTGGMLGKIFTSMPGSSAYFSGGVIAYSNNIKINVLKVPNETIENYGAVSNETAAAMAAGVRKLTGASIGVSITGIAGPDGGTDEKPVGTTCIGIEADGYDFTKQFLYGTDRRRNRLRACYSALDLIRRYLYDIK